MHEELRLTGCSECWPDKKAAIIKQDSTKSGQSTRLACIWINNAKKI
jgi:hypothetical protein